MKIVITRATDNNKKYRATDEIIQKRHELFLLLGFQYSEVTKGYFNTDILFTIKRDYMERWQENQFIDVINYIIGKFLKLREQKKHYENTNFFRFR